jgi:hypothetical protein
LVDALDQLIQLEFSPCSEKYFHQEESALRLKYLLKIVSGFSVNPLPSGCVAVPERERELPGIRR